MIKLVAIDLDGTLLSDDKQLSLANIEAIQYLIDRDIRVVLCTGRPYLAMKNFVPELGIDNPDEYIITFNGSLVQRADNGEVLISDTITTTDMLNWYKELSRVNLPMNIVDQKWVYEPTSYPEGHESFYTTSVTTAPSKVKDFYSFEEDHQFNKIVVTINEDYLDQQWQEVNPDLIHNFAVVKSHPFQTEIGKRGVTKGNALRLLGEKLGIDSSEMMAFGDQGNDYTMISYAGIGVAMGNAVSEIKDIADYVTDSNNDDGVAKGIYHYIK